MLVGPATGRRRSPERRRDAGEIDALIGRSSAAREAGLRRSSVSGRTAERRPDGRRRSWRSSPCALGPGSGEGTDGLFDGLVIPYEAVWAIGTGRTPRGSDAAAMADAIRATLADLSTPDRAAEVPVLYGGSVTAAAIGEFLAEPSIDGALVGGASLKSDEMAGIVGRAGVTAAARAATASG
jgi:triosephosphate isomerase